MRVAGAGSIGAHGRARRRRGQGGGTQWSPSCDAPVRRLGTIERVAEGRDAAALATALAGCDAAVFAIGPSGAAGATADHTVMRQSMPALVEAMRSAGVPRLVVVSASGPFTDGDDPFLRYVALKPIVQRILREPFSDFVATEPVVRSSDLDLTIVRPPQLNDGSARGRHRPTDDAGVPFGISIVAPTSRAP